MQALISRGAGGAGGPVSVQQPGPEDGTRVLRYERREARLPGSYDLRIKADRKAWQYLQSATPSYRKQVAFWILSAKKEETRIRRLEVLIASSRRGEPIPPLRWSMRGKPTDRLTDLRGPQGHEAPGRDFVRGDEQVPVAHSARAL